MKISIITVSILLSAFFMISCAAEPEGPADIDTGEKSEHGFDGFSDGTTYDNNDYTWKKANLTSYESYPDPNSEECIEFKGCEYEGELAYFNGHKKSESWIKGTNIIAVHEDDWSQYRGKIIRVRLGSLQIDTRVYDMCSDADCNNCCTNNSKDTGFLIDMEKYTSARFGADDKLVLWTCLDC